MSTNNLRHLTGRTERMSRRFRRVAITLVATVCSLQTSLLQAQARVEPATHERPAQPRRDTTARVLYRALPYGSQAYFSPLTVLLNKGFDHFQARNARRDVWAYPYGNALSRAVFDALRNPRAAIDRDPGMSKWLRTEILPLSYRFSEASWVVNYTEHMLAGGLTYRMLGEWFTEQGVPAPRVFAAATTFTAAMLNEAAEYATAERGTAASVADLYVFDLGGILLFNWNPLVRFFGDRLQAADWSNQATFTAPDGLLRNTGQYYVYKIPLPAERWRLFVRGGMGAQVGFTRSLGREFALSTSLGADTEVRNVDSTTNAESIKMKFGGGLFIDRRNSLLASLTMGPTAQRVTLNVYPGVLPGVLRDVGVWGAATRDGRFVYGLAHRRALGLGVGYSAIR